MPITGAQEAKTSIARKIDLLANAKMEKALAIIAADIGARADFYVPTDTTNLVKSRRTEITPTSTGWHAKISYNAPYAKYLHDNAGWKPKPVPSPGKLTGAYNPNAEFMWLDTGANEGWPAAKATFRRVVKL